MLCHQGCVLCLDDLWRVLLRTGIRLLRENGETQILALFDLGKRLIFALICAVPFAKCRYAATTTSEKSKGGYIKAGSGKHMIENPSYLMFPAYTKT
uniref:Uncharacterized protein n=1 Tax=Aquisalinus luteolus TaxID=1566827 RepID=A0A8J3A1F7_9PROT|nr:hypothetical protein GCM10011355_13630 [Aquisalinus luteolus]